MALEFARLCVGLLIAGFHAQIADFILAREHSLILACRQRGFELRTAIPPKTAHNLYFAFGILIALRSFCDFTKRRAKAVPSRCEFRGLR
jgi:hypothetical protein